jgi:Rps23 Pro-64 3,4-dihydroxylase Tpa1-like proline 4-hydroxylase
MNPFIWVKDDVISREICESIIKKFNADERKSPGITGSGYQPKAKRSTDLVISGKEEWKEEDALFFDVLAENHPQYQKYVDDIMNGESSIQIFRSVDVKDSGYQIQKTIPGEEYVWHNDSAASVDYNRALTYIWYLNDVPEGGETEFYDGTLIKPVRGRMVIFPATWTFMHRGKTPASDKYIVTGWMSYRTTGLNQSDDVLSTK